MLLIASVTDPYDAKTIQWINNRIEILVIFATALVGMFAFSSALQGWFVTKCNLIERVLLFALVPFALVPNICEKYFSFIANEGTSQLFAILIYVVIFMKQWLVSSKNQSLRSGKNNDFSR